MKIKSFRGQVYLLLFWLLLLSLRQGALSSAAAGRQGPAAVPLAVAYCDMLANAQDYDGKEVSVRASYRYGFEWQELFCIECRNLGKTWLDFDQDNPQYFRAAL